MNCLNCGKETPHWGKIGKKYCHLKCAREYDLKISKKIFKEINCIICNNKFMPKSFTSKYCSKYCKVKYESSKRTNKPKIKNCNFCHKEYAPYTALTKFCSVNCRIENIKSKRSFRWNKESAKKRFGKNNPYYQHGLQVRGIKIDSTGMRLFHKRRDSYKEELISKKGYLYCERCNISNVRFETHHIVYRSEKPRHEHLHCKQNLIFLCVPCHRYFHTSKGNRDELVLKRELHLLFGNDILNKTKL